MLWRVEGVVLFTSVLNNIYLCTISIKTKRTCALGVDFITLYEAAHINY